MMVFLGSLRDSKSPQVSRILLSILADLNRVVVWMVSTLPLISKSSSPYNNTLVIAQRALIIIGINVSFIFHSFFNSLARSSYLSFFSLSFNFIMWSAGTAEWLQISPGHDVWRVVDGWVYFSRSWYLFFLWSTIPPMPSPSCGIWRWRLY